MANTQDLLGSLLRRGLTPSSSSRIEHSLGENGIGGLGGILEQLGLAPAKEAAAAPAPAAAGSSPASARGAASATRAAAGRSASAAGGAAAAGQGESAGAFDPLSSLGQLAKSIFGEGAQGKSLAAGGLGALAGAILGGGGGSARGAMKGGALALLGSIALQALRGAQQKGQEKAGQGGLGAIDPASQLAAGLRAPANDREEQEVSSIADLTVRAMINAAKVDGRIDEDEMQKFVGELQADGLSPTERDYLLAEVRKPLTTAEIVRAVPNQQVAAQVYAASLLAIEVDTEAEKNYLQTLARDLKLDSRVTQQIHQTLGV